MTSRRRIVAAVIAAALFGLVCSSAALRAELRIDITSGHVEPVPIAIPSFPGGAAAEIQAGSDTAAVVSADLERSGLFRPLDPRSFIQNFSATDTQPRFPDWRQINAQALVTGAVKTQSDGRLRVEFRLWDVFAEQQLAGYGYTTTQQNWRRIAHIIADEIYKRITGEEGYFDTRIVYVAEAGPPEKRIKRLAIMDQDGANNRILTDGRALVLTPRFSPTAQEITYLSYGSGTPRVYLFNIDTGQQEVVGDFPGMTFAPRFSPDGQRVIMSLQQGGNANLFVMDLRSKQTTRLTDTPAIDTAPCYSPDGSRICFESDRGGTQQVYIMPATGGPATRISFGEGHHSTPVWSPRGDYIAFTGQARGNFAIGVLKPDGSGERLLTEGFHNEGPTFAPNGRVLMFFRDVGQGPALYTIDISGRNELRVPTPSYASDPAWSPLLS